jgi:PAS domain S-box-containing protein
VFMVSRDGTEVPIDQIATPMRDNLGRISGIVLVLRTLPKSKPEDPERALAETINLLDAVDASMLVVDLKGCCAFASKSAAELMGYQAYELAGRDVHEFLPSSSTGDWAYAEQELAATGTAKHDLGALMTSGTLSRRDATEVPVELSRAPLLVGEQIVGTVVTITDLTERRRAQQAVTRLELITDSVDEAIITHTADGVISSWNRAAERIYGYLEEEVLGRHISIIHPPGYRHELQKLFDRVLSLEQVEPFETVRVKKGGERISVSINALALDDESGAPASVAQIVSDLTERKKAEAAALLAKGQSADLNRRLAAAVNKQPTAPVAASSGKASVAPVAALMDRSPQAVSEIMVGRSPVMKKLYATIERVAPSDSSILITGATGTGKELVARAIHEKSRRAGGVFVDVNCSAIPETLVEAELFGHQRGTFTGAHENRPGLFEAASGGTIFLDEVDSLPLAAQAKLLRVLQDKRVRRVGGRTNIAVDVRIISATNSDLSQAISEGRFRADLFYRLRVFPIHTPELCHRQDDIELLVDYFLDRHADQQHAPRRYFNQQAMKSLLRYSWPGNVRELESAVNYALAIGTNEEMEIDDLPPEFARQVQPAIGDLKEFIEGYRNDGAQLADIEKHYILSVLQQFDGNQVRAAAALGIDRSKLYRRLKRYGVKAVRFLQEEQLDGMQLLSSRNQNTSEPVEESEIGLARSTASVG